MLSGLEGSVVVTLVLTRLLLENGDVLSYCWLVSVLFFWFFSWEQENEERQPSKGHFPRDQEMILQIYGLEREEKKSWQLCCVLSYC